MEKPTTERIELECSSALQDKFQDPPMNHKMIVEP